LCLASISVGDDVSIVQQVVGDAVVVRNSFRCSETSKRIVIFTPFLLRYRGSGRYGTGVT